MSIYTGLEDTIRLLRGRNDNLHKQNDELSDRIHLDLDPRVKRLAVENSELRLKTARQLTEIVAFDEMNTEQHDRIERLVRECHNWKRSSDELAGANDGLEDRISEQRLLIEQLSGEAARGDSNRRRLKRIAELAGRAL